jgi:hypothetical protein
MINKTFYLAGRFVPGRDQAVAATAQWEMEKCRKLNAP